jgi:hypothetical protein
MSNQILISSGAKLRDLDDVIIGTDGVLTSLGFNVANGVPKLDENGKILVSQLPNSVMEFKGVWNAATNTPTLANGTGNAGDVWLCNVAGTVNFGAGPIAFSVGDYAVYTGTVWARSSGATGTVTSVGLSRDGDALSVTGSPITTSGTINLGFTGTNLQYINGAGNLTTFPDLTVYVPTSRTLTINDVTYDLSADRSWTIDSMVYPDAGIAVSTGTAWGTSLIDNSGNWNTAYNNSIISASVTGTTTKTLTLDQQDGGTITASWTDYDTAPVTSVFGRTGAVVAVSGDYNTDQVTEGTTNLYFTNARSRAAISLTTLGTSGEATYNNTTGVLNIPNYTTDLTGYVPYTGATTNVNLGTHSLSAYDLIINHTSGSGVAASITKNGAGEALTVVKGSGSGNAASITGGVTLLAELHLTTDLADAYIASAANWNTAYTNRITSATSPLSIASNVISISLANTTTSGYLSSTDWNTFNGKQAGSTNLTSLAALTFASTSFVKMTAAGTFALDTNTYALASALGSYVPYTGATGAVNLGANNLSAKVGSFTDGQTFVTLISADAAGGYVQAFKASDGTSHPFTIYAGSNTAGFKSFRLNNTGATLDTALNGTTAAFSGSINGGRLSLNNTGTAGRLQVKGVDSEIIAYFYNNSGSAGVVNGVLIEAGTNGSDYALRVNNSTGTNLFEILGNSNSTFNGSLASNQTDGGVIYTKTAGALVGLITSNFQITGVGSKLDLNAYVYGANPFGIWTNGFRILTVSGGGNVLIGTSTDGGYKLDVLGTSRFSSGISLSNNNVPPTGAGIYQGINYLQLVGGSSGLSINNSTNTVANFVISDTGIVTLVGALNGTSGNFSIESSATDSVTNVLTLTHTTTGTAASGLGAGILFRAERPSSGITLNRGAIYGVSGTDADDDGDLAFYTLTSTATNGFNEKMRLTSAGRLGIGTIAPNAPLDVISATSDSSIIQQWSYNSAPAAYRLQLNTIVSSGLVKYSFDLTNNSTAYANNFVLDRGFIGINTASPTERLHINSSNNAAFIRFQNTGGSGVYIGSRNDTMELYAGGANRMVIGDTGIVSIGAGVTGGGQLQVNGNVNINGVFQINGVTIGGGGGSGVTGSGTANYVTKWTGSSTLGNSVLYDSGTGIGIGTATVGTYALNILSANASGIILNSSATGGSWMAYATSGTVYGYMSTGYHLFSGGAATEFGIRAETTLVFGIAANERMRISNGGNLLVGTASDNGYKLQINGSASFAYGFLSVFRGSSSPNDILVGNTGSVFYIGGNTQVVGSVSASGGFFDTSDSRLKTLVENNYLLSSIANVKARLYKKDGRMELGYYAQDIENILPSAVKEGSDGFLSLSYAQVHTAKIAVIEDEVNILKNRVSELEKQLNLN